MTERPLAGRAALVTGGATGIGLGCARALLREGVHVTLAGRRTAVLDEAAAALRAAAPGGVEVGTAVCDVTDEEHVAAAVAAAGTAAPLTLCVANAGFGSAGPLLLTDRATWDAVLGTNLTGAFLTIKHAAAAMVAAGGGSIVAVSSIAGPLTHRYMAPYAVSKAGLEMLVRQAADELGQRGVRVNAVRPGLVPTDATTTLTGTDAIRDDYLAQMPLHRLGTPEDVADLVRFLLGPSSSWITGQCIGVDGGHTLRRGPDLEGVMRMVFGDDVIGGR